MGFRQIFPLRARFEQKPRRAAVRVGIYAGLIHARFAARGPDHVRGRKDDELRVLRRGKIERNHARSRRFPVFPTGQQAHRQMAIPDGDLRLRHPLFERFRHVFGRIRPGRRSAVDGIVIRFIADVFAAFIDRERNPKLDQMEEGTNGIGRFRQRDIAVHTAALKQRSSHLAHAVLNLSAQRKLVIGLFIRSRISGSAHAHPFGYDGDVRLPHFVQAKRRIQPRRAASDDDRVIPPENDALFCLLFFHILTIYRRRI